jgi:hypothetical protein
LEPRETVEPAPVCPFKPSNGQLIQSYLGSSGPGHLLTIDNGTAGNAIVKVRNAATGRTVVSFYVAESARASLNLLDDGIYRIEYMLGRDLAGDCKTFIRPFVIEEFPGNQEFATTRTEAGITIDKLTFTLYPVPFGNIVPRSIDLKQFDAD